MSAYQPLSRERWAPATAIRRRQARPAPTRGDLFSGTVPDFPVQLGHGLWGCRVPPG